MAQTVASPAVESHLLQRRLGALRRRLRLVVGFRGVSWLLAVVLLSGTAVGLLDWYIHLPALVRAVALVATLSAAGVLAYRHLFLPLCAPVDDLALALRVEEHFAGLNDSLASTVEFLQQPADSELHGSPGLRREAVRRALRRAEKCDFGRVIDRRGLYLAGPLMLLAVGLVTALGVLYPAQARTALLRFANPFGGVEWPKQTQLEIDPPRERIGKNEAFEVRGRVRGVIPEKAVVTFQLDGSQVITHTCDVAPDEKNAAGTFVTFFKPDQVQRRFRFQVQAHDALSPWYDVAVLPPPQLSRLQVRVEPPAYTDLPPLDLPDGTGDVDAVAGTRVTVRAAADRPLARAWVEFEPEPWLTEAVVPAELDPDRQALRVHFFPRVAGRYVLHIEDDAGLHYSRIFDLQVHDDPAPDVKLERPSDKRDILSVLPTAELPLLAGVDDLQYAVRSVWLEYRVRKAGEPATRTDPPLRWTLFDSEKAPGWGPFAVLAPPARLREKHVDIDHRLPLAALPGVQLREGDVLTLQVCADDFDDVTLHKQPGRSHEVEIRIIGRGALDKVLGDEQARVQQELLKLLEKERNAIKGVASVQANLKALGKLDGDDLNRLQQVEDSQEAIRKAVGERRADALRGEVARILEALKNNQLPRTAAQDRMEQVGSQLERLAREELEPIESRLNSARRQSESPEARQQERQRQAQFLERLAEAKEKEAKGAEKLATERPDTDPGKAALRKLAPMLRQQAEELRQTAQAMNQGREEAAPERERHARLLEELAQEAGKEAEAARQLADKLPESDPQRAAAEGEAQQLQQAAQELRQMAQEQRQGKAAENTTKEQLAEARRHQEEVEKTLNDLIDRVLDPFSSTVEIKGDARAILQEERRLLQETEEVNKQLQGGRPEELPKPQQAQLEQMKDEQRRLTERTAQLLNKMAQVQLDRRDKGDHATAQEMQQALEAAQKGELGAKMEAARDQLGKNQLNQAAQSQRASIQELEKLVKQLEDRREAELDRLAKRFREMEKEMDKLTEEQEQLQKKLKEAAAIADPQKRAEELKRLARRQQELQQRAQQMKQELQRMRMGRAGQEMDRAAQQMEDALRRLERGENPEEQQEEALDRLDEARKEMEQARRDVEEELAREQLAKIADQIKALRERQDTLTQEGERIQRELQNREPGLWRGLLISLGQLSDNQKALGKEVAAVTEEKLAGAPVFARILERAAQEMEQASDRMRKHRQEVLDKGKPESPDGAEAARLQKEALRRLDQLLDALKEPPGRPMRPGGGDGGDGGGGGSRPPGDGIPALAQLKLLRAMQAEVNQRTDAFKKDHPDLTKLPPALQAELQAIERDQRDVANLLEELLGPANPEGGKP